MTDLYNDLAKLLNVPADQIKAALASEEAAGNLIITQQGDAVGNAKIGLLRLSNYFDGKMAFAEVGQALGMVFEGIASTESIAELPSAKVPTRPKADGLSEALTAIIATNKEFPAEMYNANLHSVTVIKLQDLINGRREVEKEVTAFQSLILNDLTVYERSAADMLATGYGKVRDKALAEHKFGESLADMEHYQFGPAKQAATSRAKGTHLKKTLTAQVPHSIYVKGQQQGRTDAIQQLNALLNDPTVGTVAGTLPTTEPHIPAAPAHPASTHHVGSAAKRHK